MASNFETKLLLEVKKHEKLMSECQTDRAAKIEVIRHNMMIGVITREMNKAESKELDIRL